MNVDILNRNTNVVIEVDGYSHNVINVNDNSSVVDVFFILCYIDLLYCEMILNQSLLNLMLRLRFHWIILLGLIWIILLMNMLTMQ